MRALKISLVAVLGLGLAGCGLFPEEKPRNVDDPDQGGQQCIVVDRQVNQNGYTAFLKIDCDGGKPDNAVTRSLMEVNEWPKCVPQAYWPECKED